MINAKRKGNRFEQDAAFMLRQALWPECFTSRFMGSLWQDHLGVDLTGTPGYNFQCKHSERLSPGLHEILAGMPKGKNINVVLHKRNNKGIIAAMNFEDFIKIIKRVSDD